MNNKRSLSSHHPAHRHVFPIRGLALAAIIGVCAAGSATAFAQATAGKIFGKAPAGDTVSAQSTATGLQRRVQVDAKGRYSIEPLPAGVYTVTLEENDRPVLKHLNVPVIVSRGIKVDFDCAQGECAKLADKP